MFSNVTLPLAEVIVRSFFGDSSLRRQNHRTDWRWKTTSATAEPKTFELKMYMHIHTIIMGEVFLNSKSLGVVWLIWQLKIY